MSETPATASPLVTVQTQPGWVAPLSCLLVTGALLGSSTNLAKLAIGAGLSPLAFLFWPTLGAALLLFAVAAKRGEAPAFDVRMVEYLTVSALVGVAAPNLIFFSAVPHVGAGFVALSIAFPPLLTYVGALLLGLERFRAARAAGVALALAGAVVIAWAKLRAPDAPAFWIALTLCGPVLLAIGNIYRSRRWPPGARPEALAPGMLGAAACMLLPLGLWPGASLEVPLGSSMPLLLILLQTVASCLQYTLFFILQRRGGPVYISLLGSVGAVVGVPTAVLLLGEAPPDGLAIGAVLIVLGIALVTSGAQPRRP